MTEEGKIQRAIIAALDTVPGLWFSRIKEHHGRNPDGQKSGIPDIIACYKGRLYGLEVKTAHGKASDEQLEQMRMMKAAGAWAGVVRSVDDVWRALGI